MITQKQLDKTLKQLDHIIKVYKKEYSNEKKRDWRTYEQRLSKRMREAARQLKPVIDKAYSMIKIKRVDKRGAPPKLSPDKKAMIILLKSLFQLSNREMANFLGFFSMLTEIDISYKTIERAYSDPVVQMIIHNMFIILVKKKKIKNVNLSGDGTGYSLTITKHYRTERTKELRKKTDNKKQDKKKSKKKRRKLFTHVVALMDLDTRMYVGYGTSMKSEKEAFDEACKMLSEMEIEVNSVRLDKYYSNRKIIKKFGKNTKFYLIPKKNATIRGSPEWKKMLKNFIENIFPYLGEYYRRNNSEAGFSTDKRMCGWKVWQKRVDRIHTALMSIGIWHNLMLIG